MEVDLQAYQWRWICRLTSGGVFTGLLVEVGLQAYQWRCIYRLTSGGGFAGLPVEVEVAWVVLGVFCLCELVLLLFLPPSCSAERS